MRRLISGLCLLLPLGLLSGEAATSAPEESAPPPQISDLAVTREEGQYLVAFRLIGGVDAGTREKISSGLDTGFEYRVEVTRHRRLWLDERVRQIRVRTSVRYDALSRQYGLSLEVDGEVERSSTTDRWEEAQRWVTGIRGIPIGAVADFVPPEEFTVRVKSDFPPRFVLLFIPWDRDTSWARVSLQPAAMSEHERGR